MKTKIIIASLLTSFFTPQIQAQYRSVNAMNNEISDNLDLRAVASLFGDSRDLKDFERRLNDPSIQISNLDLNYDNQVDYLRVIETVDRNTHLVIIQSVLDHDVYQDVATIDVERDKYNSVQVQFVGNEYIYGPNYIYEPVYYSAPLIYTSFFVSNYRPYISNCYWNSYPSYYYAWNPYPIYRYRSNIQVSINFHNNYTYVNNRRSNYAAVLYSSRRSNGYERLHPEYNFSRRNTSATNRYDLDQRRSSRSLTSRNENENYRNGSLRYSNTQKGQSQRDYSSNKNSSSRESASQKTGNSRDYSQNRGKSQRESTTQKTENSRDYSQNRGNTQRESATQKTGNPRDYSQNRGNTQRESATQKRENTRDYSQNRENTQRESRPQSTQNQSRFSENKSFSPREHSPQRSENNGRSSSSNTNNNRRT